MCDLFLVLARADGGYRLLPAARRPTAPQRGLAIQRLEEKLGNRSNASSEVVIRGG